MQPSPCFFVPVTLIGGLMGYTRILWGIGISYVWVIGILAAAVVFTGTTDEPITRWRGINVETGRVIWSETIEFCQLGTISTHTDEDGNLVLENVQSPMQAEFYAIDTQSNTVLTLFEATRGTFATERTSEDELVKVFWLSIGECE